ncbi:zinc-binding alcohol dehydrogenase family protein [Frateuria sp. STR12]|uniref:zinc-binding alcohol dehydrogenase family protein n=1 Tax=Frateuria hangzhouensis TaxID=2995589 RepID=UPI002260927F|nr:zinc-binding alcohol dehydrogenase family protein [Frateuria sp. STR12]MCX7514444.1 zinc-binding alcohol dehydrogenase family protein [Frateuria sp. STR12]
MKAVAFTHRLAIDVPGSLLDLELPVPRHGGHDLLVQVEAVSVNPVDTKLRAHGPPPTTPRVLGFDAAGTVLAVGGLVQDFAVGDRVYYAGDATRQGSNAQCQAVDARLVAHAPRTLDAAQAAALPLVSLTAWELLFQRMPFDSEHGGEGRSLLVIAGAGGVGSMAIQLARLAGFRVVATASRPQTAAWCRELGAAEVIDHRHPLLPQLAALGLAQVDAALNLADTDRYWEVLGEAIAPQGHVGLIVEPRGPLPVGGAYKTKSIGIHWESMFTRSGAGTADLAEQGRILARVAALVDAGQLRDIARETLSPIDAARLRQAHACIESGRSIGKLVLAGW